MNLWHQHYYLKIHHFLSLFTHAFVSMPASNSAAGLDAGVGIDQSRPLCYESATEGRWKRVSSTKECDYSLLMRSFPVRFQTWPNHTCRWTPRRFRISGCRTYSPCSFRRWTNRSLLCRPPEFISIRTERFSTWVPDMPLDPKNGSRDPVPTI